MSRIGWIDATAGVSGDMLLGACIAAGAPLDVVNRAVRSLDLPETVDVTASTVRRGALAATRAVVSVPQAHHHRTLADVHRLLSRLAPPLRERTAAVFTALGEAEAAVHGIPLSEVHFHEVGALDSIVDVVGVVAALDALHIDRLVASPIALGGGRTMTAHGAIPLPGPAVLELLRGRGMPAFGGPVDMELATPTGVALLVTLATDTGALPAGLPFAIGVGAGDREPAGHTNVCRLVLCDSAATASTLPTEAEVVLEANVDDLDPRVWPSVLAALLEAGAADAWLTPILMKKGRPAHTLSVLAAPTRVDALIRVVLTHTTTIGVRRHEVHKSRLRREVVTVQVGGRPVRAKLAWLDGAVVTATPEYEDVARLARAAGTTVRAALAAADVAVDAHRRALEAAASPTHAR
ncbi:nickel pincer cofactor biosynthesis protein LarC [Nocardioides humi]|uniref:Pyridinium-3,5-bisthiocarboxylic acid mononucleotide nickel insertion protein n=1 Tax=Nocardioides humi TaxID=449461 RepID=A0ABN2AW56_9ACTN|nr:nickel pincer cofactor biosynthesis protein LarC [Nocardioides humi]